MLGDTTVGALPLPLPAGALNGTIDDPAVLGLLDFAGFLIKWALDARLAQIQGPGNGGAPLTDACPAANRFAFNPETTHVRLPKPALFAWWDGDSAVTPMTTLYNVEQRTIRLLYVFPEVVLPAPAGGARAWTWHGLARVVDAALLKMGNEGFHPSYGYNGAPLGSSIAAVLNLVRLTYNGGQAGLLAEVPGNVSAAEQTRSGGQVQRGYPSLRASFTTLERVGLSTMEDPADVTRDTLVTIGTNDQGDVGDPVDILQGYLPPPDGSENLQ